MKDHSEALVLVESLSEEIDWDSIYRTELPRIYNFFLYKVGEKELAQELAAITFERAWKNRKRYRKTVAAISTWLFGIARNVFNENLRRRRLRGQRFVRITQHSEIPVDGEMEEAIQRQQEKDRLRRVLLELSNREQNLIAWKYGSGLTNREISKLSHISESNVGTILHRTVKKIRARLEKDDER